MFFSFLTAGIISGLLATVEIPVADSLGAATITADKGVVVSRIDVLPVSGTFSVSEVLNLSSGLHVGDNGGVAGLKSVSLRGLGSAHTAIYLDGVRVGI